MYKGTKVISESRVIYLFCCLYGFGLLWFNLSFTRELFIFVIPATLLLVIGVVLGFHKVWDLKTMLVFAFIATTAFVLELVGVSTGVPFGNYQYDRGLGLMFHNTPLLIGFNWLFLVYSSHAIVSKFFTNRLLLVLLGGALMLCYDLILECVAPVMKMWHFTTSYPPFANFFSWFIVSIIFHSLLVIFKIKIKNTPARMLFIIQLVFFCVIALIYKLIN
jgi:uncharacterized membrane protein